MKDCKEGFKRLASDSCGLVYAIIGAHSEAVVVSEDLNIHVKELLEYVQNLIYYGDLGLMNFQDPQIYPRLFTDRAKAQDSS